MEANDIHNGLSKFTNSDIGTCANVEDAFMDVVFHNEDTGVGEVIDVEEFAFWGSGAPDDEFSVVSKLGFVNFADECWKDMTVGQVVVVVGSIEVGGHKAHESRSVLAVIALAKFDAGDLGDGVGFVGLLEHATK